MNLPDLLHEIAEANPVPAPAPGLYRRARRAQLRRRLLTGATAVIAAVAFALPLTVPPAPAQPAAPGAVVRLPTHVQAPPAYTADVRDAPIDRALLAFTLSKEDGTAGEQLTIVAANDRYRTYPVKPLWLLSPDGRYLLSADGTRTEVLRLGDGTRRTVAFGHPLAWSPDGSRVVFARFAGDPQRTDPVATEVLVVAFPQDTVLWQATLPPTLRPAQFLSAAMAPDNSAVAVQLHDHLYLYTPGGLRWQRQIDGLQELPGQLAWHPAGRMFALTHPGGHASLGMVDAATGEGMHDLEDDGYLAYIGAQGNLSRQPVIVGWRDDMPTVNAGNRSLVNLPHGVLMTTAYGTHEVQVAGEGLSWRAEEPGPPDPGPATQRYRPLLLAAGKVILLGLLVGLVLRPVYGHLRGRWRRRALLRR
jgi:WD40-like Beta Propeller Repeat